jgi:hypothetical protein
MDAYANASVDSSMASNLNQSRSDPAEMVAGGDGCKRPDCQGSRQIEAVSVGLAERGMPRAGAHGHRGKRRFVLGPPAPGRFQGTGTMVRPIQEPA